MRTDLCYQCSAIAGVSMLLVICFSIAFNSIGLIAVQNHLKRPAGKPFKAKSRTISELRRRAGGGALKQLIQTSIIDASNDLGGISFAVHFYPSGLILHFFFCFRTYSRKKTMKANVWMSKLRSTERGEHFSNLNRA